MFCILTLRGANFPNVIKICKFVQYFFCTQSKNNIIMKANGNIYIYEFHLAQLIYY